MVKVCVNVIEAILVANNFMINLENFPNLLQYSFIFQIFILIFYWFSFFEGCSVKEFSNFMRVIALIVLELNENKTEEIFLLLIKF